MGRCPCLSLPSTLLPGKWLYSRQLPIEHSAQLRTALPGPDEDKSRGPSVSSHCLPAVTWVHRQPLAQAGQSAPVERALQPGVM